MAEGVDKDTEDEEEPQLSLRNIEQDLVNGPLCANFMVFYGIHGPSCYKCSRGRGPLSIH